MIIKLFVFKVGVKKSSVIFNSGNRMPVDVRSAATQTDSQT